MTVMAQLVNQLVTKKYKTRVIYNSKVDKAAVEASLACKGKRFKPLMTKTQVKTKIFAPRDKTVCAIARSTKSPHIIVNSQVTATSHIPKDALLGQKQVMLDNPAGERQVGNPRRRVSANTAQSSVDTGQQSHLQACPIYDVNLAGIEVKFTSALYNVGTQGAKCEDQNNCPLFKQWQNQSQFQFGFIPLEQRSKLGFYVPFNKLCLTTVWLVVLMACHLLTSMLSSEPQTNLTTWKPGFR